MASSARDKFLWLALNISPIWFCFSRPVDGLPLPCQWGWLPRPSQLWYRTLILRQEKGATQYPVKPFRWIAVHRWLFAVHIVRLGPLSVGVSNIRHPLSGYVFAFLDSSFEVRNGGNWYVTTFSGYYGCFKYSGKRGMRILTERSFSFFDYYRNFGFIFIGLFRTNSRRVIDEILPNKTYLCTVHKYKIFSLKIRHEHK